MGVYYCERKWERPGNEANFSLSHIIEFVSIVAE